MEFLSKQGHMGTWKETKHSFLQNTIKSNIVSTECLEKGKTTKLGLVNETLQNCKTALTSKNLPLCFITVMVMVEV